MISDRWSQRAIGRQVVNRISAYLTSRKQLAGSALALLGAGLTLADPVGPAGLVLIAGFYLLGVVAVPESARSPGEGFDPDRICASINELIAAVDGRAPVEVITRIRRIERRLREEILPRIDAIQPGSLDRHLITRTAHDYLPTAVKAYLRLPDGYVSSQPGSRGWSASQVVLDELDLLEMEMMRIAETLDRADMDRLLAHRRFLYDRFNRADASG